MSEFEKSKERYEKKAAKVVPIKQEIKPDPPKEKDSIAIAIVDNGKRYSYFFKLDGIKATRLSGQRTEEAFRKLLEQFVSKEFGRWQLTPNR